MQELLEQEPLPDAVFVSNNRMTVGALQAIEEAKLAIPEEMAVVGYDEILVDQRPPHCADDGEPAGL